MKLKDLVDLTSWKLIGANVFDTSYNQIRIMLMYQLYMMHGAREVREMFETSLNVRDYIEAFMTSNKQKFLYIFNSSNEDFLSQDNTTITNTIDESNAFNTDYYGGEGKTGKDTSTGDMTTTNKSINNKDKTRNFYDVADNYLFRQMMNVICETFTIDEEIRW